MSTSAASKMFWLPSLEVGLLLLAGCSGGQTGDGTGTHGDDGGPSNTQGELGGQCNWQREPLADLNDASALGFSATEVLEFAAQSFQSSFAWQGSELFAVGPEAGVGTLDLAVTYAGGEVFVRRQGPPPDTEGTQNTLSEIEYDCSPALEIDVGVSFRTAGGAFDEAFDTTLVAEHADLASFAQLISSENLAGSFEVFDTRPAGGVLKQVQIQGTVSPLGTYGSVSGVLDYRVEGAGSGVAVGGGGPIGSWPAEASSSCSSDYGSAGLVLAESADLGGYTAADTLAALNALSPAQLTWQDASTTTLSLAVTAQGSACARFEQGWQVSRRVLVNAQTADGRWEGSYAGDVRAVPAEDGGLQQVTLRAFLDNLEPAQFEAQSGLSGVDVSGYAYARFDLEVTVDIPSSSAGGQVTARGAVLPECLTNPPEPEVDENSEFVGVGGCEGIQLAPLWTGTF